MVALVAPFPNAVVAHAIGAGDVIDEVLQEVPLMAGLHHHQSRAGQLGELQQKEGRRIELQMAPTVVWDHGIAAAGVVLGVQAIER